MRTKYASKKYHLSNRIQVSTKAIAPNQTFRPPGINPYCKNLVGYTNLLLQFGFKICNSSNFVYCTNPSSINLIALKSPKCVRNERWADLFQRNPYGKRESRTTITISTETAFRTNKITGIYALPDWYFLNQLHILI